MLYYESHITIEPVFDKRLERASSLAKEFNFKIANLPMQKREADTPVRSMHDTFMTGHSTDFETLKQKTTLLVQSLQLNGYVVWRYKIEDVVVDSRINDEFDLLGK